MPAPGTDKDKNTTPSARENPEFRGVHCVWFAENGVEAEIQRA
jgi:hypothetical protein